MCGIAGFVDSSGPNPVPQELLAAMADRIRHRGPDDEGSYAEVHHGIAAGLVHTRLSIIDLTSGHQPLCNEDQTTWVVFNGEIYNFQELRKDLQEKGHQFKTQSDTEVLVHGYEVYGRDLPKYLRGMFAFAVWDKKNQVLFLARDRVGKKPLFYSVQSGKIAFASELSALSCAPWISKEVSPEALHDYLTFLCVPAPLTIFKDIQKLSPGCFLEWTKDRVSIESYWSPPFFPKHKITEFEAVEEIRRLFKEAVRIRLMSEVPLGAFLSGGIDSSAVVAMMAQTSGQRVKTFSIGFDEEEFNELSFARAVAKRYGTDHHEEIVRPNAIAILPMLVRRFGEPFADASAIPTYYLSQMTKRKVTVALSGDGGDELFAGYRRHLGFLLAEKYQRAVPAFIRAGICGAMSSFFRNHGRQSLGGGIRRFLDAAQLCPSARYVRWVGFFDEKEKRQLYQKDFNNRINEYVSDHWIRDLFEQAKGGAPLDAILAVDTRFYLPNDLLTKVDITSMAHSLEVRSPFLDSLLLEFVCRLPAEIKLRRGHLKYLVKKAFQEDIPSANLNRKKMGFAIPLAKWIRGPLQEPLREGLLSQQARIRRYFNQERIREMISVHSAYKRDYAYELWALLVFEYWLREFQTGSV
ncbi:MAG: asparagine synthase (glutamine-hydrolyzing) [Candidatus Omnitrophica bacterium]|nr:asparagine synthase (glutamine-hydrolyzing) [Candidatus Omnitrophota bacterium]